MLESNQAFGQALVKSLVGERGHIPIHRALSDISIDLASKHLEGSPYTIYQLVKHMSYWQNFLLTYIEGSKPQMPSSAAESWPTETEPESEFEWQIVLEQFLKGIDKAVGFATTEQLHEALEHFPSETKVGILRNIASHNSYHLGEVVLLRRMLGAWPPPGGGYPA